MNFTNIKYEIDKERNEKPKIKLLLYWALISFLSIIAIKGILRPKHLDISDTFNFLLGTLPNFFAGSGLFVISFIYFKAFYPNENSLKIRLFVAFLISFLGLTLWEVLQYFMGFSIDYYDILMTAFGNLVTISIIFSLRLK